MRRDTKTPITKTTLYSNTKTSQTGYNFKVRIVLV